MIQIISLIQAVYIAGYKARNDKTMHTELHPNFLKNPKAHEAKSVIEACVHCGFCTATCPTYQHFNDERDGPRGRIYLIKQLLETNEVSEKTQIHLDRCLTCRSCETTCPSGVQYGRLVDIGKGLVEQKVSRGWLDSLSRWSLRKVLPYPKRFGIFLQIGQIFKPLLIGPLLVLSKKIPERQKHTHWPSSNHKRRMIGLAGCAQSVATPNTNKATARVLDKLGITLVEERNAGCCGAVDYHLGAHDDGLNAMRKNIDAWWPEVEAGVEALVMTASGCGVMVEEYGDLLENDPDYAEKAKKISSLVKDISQILEQEDLDKLQLNPDILSKTKTAVHCPCTMQHGMKLPNNVDNLLEKLGVPLAKTNERHMCCGSAGTYSVLQSNTASELLDKKLNALTIDEPEQIVTSNVGCQLHLNTKSNIPVKHWIELLDQDLS